jgi:hypothetical protein
VVLAQPSHHDSKTQVARTQTSSQCNNRSQEHALAYVFLQGGYNIYLVVWVRHISASRFILSTIDFDVLVSLLI